MSVAQQVARSRQVARSSDRRTPDRQAAGGGVAGRDERGTTPQQLIFFPLTHCLKTAHMHVPGRVSGVGVYLMKRSELGLSAWCLGSWWCVLWIRTKLPLSSMSSSTRYNGSTGFGRHSPPLDAIGRCKQVQVQERECRRCISSADPGSAEWLNRSGSSRPGQIWSQTQKKKLSTWPNGRPQRTPSQQRSAPSYVDEPPTQQRK
jgi:hypothetical protein